MTVHNAHEATLSTVREPHPPRPLIAIRPSRGWAPLRLNDLWEYRELFYFLIWRDIKVRYKQTALGAAWAIIQPVVTMVVFSFFFGRLAKIPSDGVPYPIFAYTALLPWQLFSLSLVQASNSLVNSSNLIRKVYFPRMIVPIASVLASVVDFAIAFVVLLAMMVYYGMVPGLPALLLPLMVLLALCTATGVSLWLAALNVRYRDVRHIMPFLAQFWMFATPVVYPSSLLAEPWRTLYGINPMTGVVEGFRWALLGTEPPGSMIAVSVVASIVIQRSGAPYFRRMEQSFADII